ncbi:hypothetical protein [Cuneatibacter caecimuris]|uniref:Amidase-like protein n=1 Tax=Cuneatibacter caecimuris TaxID=1796618 RepID=A0A4Q7P0X6_9FIRM|nr:hypothetical protein [Cuneatibacter caecimuris]RZS93020.1 hypothetical protein EV209_2766 [Cuneatibacter caecimuris]
MKKLICTLSAVLCCFCSSHLVFADNAFLYPVNRDSSIWKEFSSHLDMIEACDVSVEKLNDLTTEELLQYVLEYPLLVDMFLFDSLEDGILALREHCGSLAELLEREDVSTILFDFYEQNIVVSYANYNEADPCDLKDYALEGILSYLYFKGELKNPEKDKFLSFMEPEISVCLSDSLSLPKTKGCIYKQMSNEQVDLTKKEALDVVYTPVGTPVSIRRTNYDDADHESLAREAEKEMLRTYPNASKIASATYQYNCHAYAWYQSLTNILVWMENPWSYMHDGSYAAVSYSQGEKIYYDANGASYKGDHSGNITSSSAVISKWGIGPLMRHAHTYCPYYTGAEILTYYKRVHY